MKHKVSSLIVLFIGILFFFIGCGAKPTINLDKKPDNQFPQIVQKQPETAMKGSLYSRAGTSLFADKKDLQIGDILQVNISESLTKDSSTSKALSKKGSTSLSGGIVTPITGVVNTQGTTDRINQINNAIGVGFESGSANTFTGSAKTSADEEFETVISVVITNVYQNGNYFIKGSKEMLINDEKQSIAISGVIRPYDISPENTVLSSQIANLKILYDKKGDEADALEKPWGSKLLEKIWPF